MVLAGCSPYGPEELDRLMKEDPDFKLMVATRDQMSQQMRLIKDDLLAKKKGMDAQVGKLRQDYDTFAKSQNVKIEKFKAVSETNRNQLAQEIQTAAARLKDKGQELRRYEEIMKGWKGLLKNSKSTEISSRDKQKWEEDILRLEEKMRPLKEVIEELKIQIRLKKRKLSFLR